ncbi:O-methyltransferase [Nakamurella sp. PAMC28650]|jgi:predicted O-methyltransferase YrrM|uniref:O-methyltransferase n=1 Tax=Nakamurella sp. PAMC28650 TaxID=2762325 RepID=UPI00164ED1DB|nr:O-methyltransferase [Nakamurella sp. PAMC28650]QNK80124.1 O-methyltransferase [Nakamurella sp. PAMC28650]
MTSSRSFAEFFVPEHEAVLTARGRAADLGCEPIGSGAGAALTFLAAVLSARAVVEIGTGTGVSGLHLLAGMAPDGVLTSIDIEAEHQRAAREAFGLFGVAPGRARLINGRGFEVVPRLTDGAYDLVLVDADRTGYPQYVEQSVRLLRKGGVLVLAGALHGDKVADPTQRDAETVAVREAGRLVRDDETLVPMMTSLGDGLLAAVKR